MFTGLAEETGRVRGVKRNSGGLSLVIGASRVLEGTRLGDSIMVSGSCLTVTELGQDWFSIDLSPETVDRTTWGEVRPGRVVNLERALQMGDRLGGHLVSGHVDGVGSVRGLLPEGSGRRLRVNFPRELAKFLAEKGSVTVDGISLTVASRTEGHFEAAIIPHTLAETSLGLLSSGDRVNLEVDLLARYLDRLLAERASGGLSRELLERSGLI